MSGKKSTHTVSTSELMKLNRELLERCEKLEEELRALESRRRSAREQIESLPTESIFSPINKVGREIKEPTLSAAQPRSNYFKDRCEEIAKEFEALDGDMILLIDAVNPVLRPAPPKATSPAEDEYADSEINGFFSFVLRRINKMRESISDMIGRVTL